MHCNHCEKELGERAQETLIVSNFDLLSSTALSGAEKMEGAGSKKMLSDSKLKVTSSYLSNTLQPQRLVSFCAFITHTGIF